MATVSDKRIGIDQNSNSYVDYYMADVVSEQDYYPGGMQMPGRSFTASSSSNYRYGFNGKEKDNEVKGDGNQYDYGFRIYDPRVVRFLAVDPLQKQYPELTPYQFAGNSPIAGMDLDGREFSWFMFEAAEKKFFGTTHLQNIREGFTERAIKTVTDTYHGIKNELTKVHKYGDGTTNLTFGIPPNPTALDPKMNPATAIVAAKEVIKDYSNLIKNAANGDDKAIGALGFEAAMIAIPEIGEIKAVKYESEALIYSSKAVDVFSTIVKNSGGSAVERKFVTSEDDLLAVAENFAGGSLDNFEEFKPNWWQGEINGKKIQIEWQPGGEASTQEGPHVKINEWDSNASNGKGKWKTTNKYFQADYKTAQELNKLKNK